MNQTEITRCFQCGAESTRMHAFARISQNGAMIGVAGCGVCDECVKKRVEKIKQGKDGRFTFLLPLLIIGAFGVPTLLFSATTGGKVLGLLITLLAVGVSTTLIVQHQKEVRTVREASDEENMKTVSAKMCAESAAKQGTQAKLAEMKLEYATDDYSLERIAREAGVSVTVATLMKIIVLQAVVKTVADKSGVNTHL